MLNDIQYLNYFMYVETIVIIEILKELRKENIKNETKDRYIRKRLDRFDKLSYNINKHLNNIIVENAQFLMDED